MEISEEFSLYLKAAEFLLAKDQERCKASPTTHVPSKGAREDAPAAYLWTGDYRGRCKGQSFQRDKTSLINCRVVLVLVNSTAISYQNKSKKPEIGRINALLAMDTTHAK